MADIANKALNDDDIIKSIMASEEKQDSPLILNEAPTVDSSLLEGITPPKSILLIFLRTLSIFAIIAAVGLFIAYQWQLTGAFDFVNNRLEISTLSKQANSTNAQIIKSKTDLNELKILEAKGYLDKFSYTGDSYLQFYEVANSQTSSLSEKNRAALQMASLRTELQSAFERAQASFPRNLEENLVSVPGDAKTDSMIFRNELANSLRQKANKLINVDDPQAKRDYRNYVNTISLIGNEEIVKILDGADFGNMTDTELYELIKKVNSIIVNDISVIGQVKEKRVKWSDVMNEIELKTIAVDSHYSQDFYDLLGGIRYTSYDFDSEKRSISIIGELKRYDTINFTMITNLIEQLNQSLMFQGAEMRSFSKSGSVDEGYTSSLKLSVNLK